MNRFVIFAAVTGLVALSACAADKKHADRGPVQMIYSPTGDPLNGGPLGRPTCPEAMKHWFARVDIKHDGAITPEEFINDAKAQFQRMDIDKNSYLVSEEVERFRLPYRDTAAEEKHAASADDREDEQPSDGRHGRGHGGGGNGGGSEGGGNASVIDPVMSADTNLDYKVTLDEFLAYAQKTFKGLDADRDGKLSLTEVTTIMCGADQNHEKH
jgi:Ca2+-binding EF-hand superfamily protein